MTPEAGELAGNGTPPRIVLHVGAPKCGSSSVQTALSQRPTFEGRDGRRYSYLCVGADHVLTGRALRSASRLSAYGYQSSSDFRADQAGAVLSSFERGVREVLDGGRIPILSSEGWLLRSGQFRDSGVIERLGGGAHVVLSVRPPLDWLNAAWWQWGVWSGVDRLRYLRKQLSHPNWVKWCRAWAKVPGVAAVHVRLVEDDAVRTLFDLLDADPPPARSVNASLPPALLAFLLRNSDLRPGPHDSAIEFQLARALRDAPPPPRAPSLWCMTPEEAEALWDPRRFRASRLTPLLRKADRRAIRAEPRWRGPEAYADRRPTDLAAFTTPEALRDLHDWLVAAAGRPPAAGPIPDAAEADAHIRALVTRLISPRSRLHRVLSPFLSR